MSPRSAEAPASARVIASERAPSPSPSQSPSPSPSPEPDLAGVLLEVARTIATILDPKPLLQRLAALTLDALGAERCAIFLGDGPAGLRPVAASALHHDPEIATRLFAAEPLNLAADRSLLRAWKSSRPISIEDVATSRRFPPHLRGLGSRSVASSTLRAGSQKLGLIVVDYATRAHRFTPAQINTLAAIASTAGVAIRNARLFEQLTATAERPRRLLLCAGLLRGTDGVDEAFDRVAEGFAAALDRSSCLVAIEGDDELTVVAGQDSAGVLPATLTLPAGARALAERRWANDPGKAVAIGDGAWMEHPAGDGDIEDVLLVPLSDGVERHAVALVCRHDGPAFTVEDVEMVEAFASEAVIAIRAAMVRETLGGQIRAVEVLRRLSGAVIGRTDLKAALEAINESVLAGMGFEGKGLTFSDRALCSLLDVALPADEDARLLQEWRRQRTREPIVWTPGDRAVAVGIRLSGRVAGIFKLEASHRPRPWERELLQTLADGIGDVAYRAKLRRLGEQRAQELAVSRERERIACDLHDTIGQLLYGLCLKAQGGLTLDLENEAQRSIIRTELEEINRFAAEGIRDLRAAVYLLSFLHIKSQGFVASVRRLVRDFGASTGIDAQLRLPTERRPLPEEVESALYRVVHEALTNVDRHARATFVVVTLDIRKDRAELQVRDDGVGIDQRQAADWRSSAHFGVRMMARLVQENGGTFAIDPASPRGLTIRASIPFQRQERPWL